MKKFFLLFGASLILTLSAGAHASAQTNPFRDVCREGQARNSEVCTNEGRTSDPLTGTTGIFYNVSRIISLIAGVAAVIIIIVGGLYMMLANGDSAKIANGRNAVIYAIVGLIVIVVAQSIITLVVNRL